MKKLYRSRRDRLIGGVCAGIGRYLGVPPIWVRIGWVASLLFLGPLPFVLYVAAVVLLPLDRDEPIGPPRREVGGWVLIAAGAFLLAHNFGLFPLSFPVAWGAVWGAALVLLGALLLRKEVRLRRSEDRKVAGVCGGIGEQIGMDPNIVRLLWVLGTLLSFGGGVLAYILLWALLPKPDHNARGMGWDGEPDMPRG